MEIIYIVTIIGTIGLLLGIVFTIDGIISTGKNQGSIANEVNLEFFRVGAAILVLATILLSITVGAILLEQTKEIEQYREQETQVEESISL